MEAIMQAFLLGLHSGVRWLVVLVTLVILVKLIINLAQQGRFDPLTQRLMAIWSGLASLQGLIGIILFIALGQFDVGYRWAHAVTLMIAVAVANQYRRFKDAPDPIKNRNYLVIVLVVLALIFIGVALLPGERWFLRPLA
jgi:hypothetical protein